MGNIKNGPHDEASFDISNIGQDTDFQNTCIPKSIHLIFFCYRLLELVNLSPEDSFVDLIVAYTHVIDDGSEEDIEGPAFRVFLPTINE